MKNPFLTPNNQNNIITGIEMMGDNLRKKLKYCGDSVILYPLCKMIRAENAEIDDYSRILDNVFIDAGKSLKIGKYSMLTWFTLIEGGANTYIGDRVFIGPGTKILTSTYKINGVYASENLDDKYREIMYGDITIEDDAYIGANCTILPGTTIHKGAVIGANSLVNKDIESWGVYVGSPCKKISEREKPSKELEESLMNDIDWSPHF